MEREITMATIKEDYVSFEIAKLLKEKGFNIACEYQYINCSSGSPFLTDIRDDAGCYYKNTEIGQDEYSAPTLQMTMKWLREEHNIVCNIDIESRNFYYYSIFIIRSSIEAQYQLTSQKPYFKTYEEACEAAIMYPLEHLI